jgi:hypothetical protein
MRLFQKDESADKIPTATIIIQQHLCSVNIGSPLALWQSSSVQHGPSARSVSGAVEANHVETGGRLRATKRRDIALQ